MKIPAQEEEPPRDDLDLERGGKREDKINRHVEGLRQYAQQSSLISLTTVIHERSKRSKSNEERGEFHLQARKMQLKVSFQPSACEGAN